MKKFDIEFYDTGEKSNAISIRIGGELTLESIEPMKQEIVKNISDKQEVALLINDVEEIDMPFYQFLFSIHKTLKKQQKKITIELNLSEEEDELFRKSGFDYNFS
jgi:ABC-type transporter Mla MlaB component